MILYEQSCCYQVLYSAFFTNCTAVDNTISTIFLDSHSDKSDVFINFLLRFRCTFSSFIRMFFHNMKGKWLEKSLVIILWVTKISAGLTDHSQCLYVWPRYATIHIKLTLDCFKLHLRSNLEHKQVNKIKEKYNTLIAYVWSTVQRVGSDSARRATDLT